jgi:hypothetical protein
MSELRDRAIITLEVPARYGQTIADFLSMLSIDSTVSLEFGKSGDSLEETVCRQNALNPNRFTMITAPVTGIETPIITKENLAEGKYRKGLLAEKLPELVELLKAGYQLPGVGDLGVRFLEEYNSDLYRAVETKPQAQ